MADSIQPLPLVRNVPSLSTLERAQILDALFEPSTQLHTLSLELLRTQQFPSYADLIASIGVQLTELAESPSTSDTEWVDAILVSHPRLGEKTVESKQSQSEQAHLKTVSEEESQKLAALNLEYEETFPSLRYVVFVSGRSRSSIMDDMQARINRGDIRSERLDAIKAMCEIASDRSLKLSSS